MRLYQATREHRGEQPEQRRRRREEHGDLGLLLLHREARGERAVDLLQVDGIGAEEVFGAGDARHLLQRRFVELHVHRPAPGVHDRALGRADAHGVDPHPALGRDLRGLDRVGTGGVLPVGEQDDDGGAVRAGRHGLRGGLETLHRVKVDLELRDNRLQRDEYPRADGGGVLRLQAVERGDHVVAVLRGRLHQGRGAGELDDADARRVRLGLDERLGRLARGSDAVGLHVGGPHAARDIDRKDHRLVLARQTQHCGRPRQRDEPDDQRKQEDERRNVAPPFTARDRGLDELEACVAQGDPLPVPEHQEVEGDDERHHRRLQDQRLGPQKCHTPYSAPASASSV